MGELSREFLKISLRKELSKSLAVSERLPREARAVPNCFCTFFSSLICCNERSEVQTGLNMYSRIRETYLSGFHKFTVTHLVFPKISSQILPFFL